MLPNLHADNIAYGHRANPEPVGNGNLLGPKTRKAANLSNQIICEFGKFVILTNRKPSGLGLGPMPITPWQILWLGSGPASVSSCNPLGHRPRSMPSLGHHVYRIVCNTAKEQVRRVAARWVVAAVADAYAVVRTIVRNIAVREQPRNAMRLHHLPVHLEPSVAAPVPTGRPVPASIRATSLIDLRPESSFEWYNRLSHARAFRVWSGAGPAASTATGSVYLSSDYNMLADAGA